MAGRAASTPKLPPVSNLLVDFTGIIIYDSLLNPLTISPIPKTPPIIRVFQTVCANAPGYIEPDFSANRVNITAADEPARIKSTRSIRSKVCMFIIWAHANKIAGIITATFRPRVFFMYLKIIPLNINSSHIPAVIPRLKIAVIRDIQNVPGLATYA